MLCTAFAGSAAVTVLAVLAGDRNQVAALAGYALVAAAVSGPARLAITPAAAAIGWLFDNGFVSDRHAVLGWHGSADLWRLGILLAAAAAGSLLGAGARVRGHAQPAGPPPAADLTEDQEIPPAGEPSVPARTALALAGGTEAGVPPPASDPASLGSAGVRTGPAAGHTGG